MTSISSGIVVCSVSGTGVSPLGTQVGDLGALVVLACGEVLPAGPVDAAAAGEDQAGNRVGPGGQPVADGDGCSREGTGVAAAAPGRVSGFVTRRGVGLDGWDTAEAVRAGARHCGRRRGHAPRP